MAPKPKFQEGEKVLCFHGPLLYEAKCVRIDVKDKQVRYFMHYNGWNKNWDEWVLESRILKCNEQGYVKQKELLKAHQAQQSEKKRQKAKQKEKERQEKSEKQEQEKKKKDKDKEEPKPESIRESGRTRDSRDRRDKEEKSRDTSSRESSSREKAPRERANKDKDKERERERSATPTIEKASKRLHSERNTPVSSQETSTTEVLRKKRARGADQPVESEETFVSKLEIKIKVPDDLKPWLIDDWDQITRQKMLVNLPCKFSVEQIIEDYIKQKTSKGNNPHKDAMVEVTNGIKEYFNVMIGTQLLYKWERPQYADILTEQPDKPMSQIYGAIHLLRLFVKLGNMLAYTQLDEKSVQLLLTHIHDVIKYMQKNMSTLFNLSDYSVAPPEYHRKAI
ncbi:mortality factor 4-like protein 1 isoform X2 [Tubulanus polymorphus]|uniref:mortality factor 4-like protein 1 isoform X2 n=1 Tax=Tubulanus polymorphus TaxID=672921 RepID=UPI003DA1E1FC